MLDTLMFQLKLYHNEKKNVYYLYTNILYMYPNLNPSANLFQSVIYVVFDISNHQWFYWSLLLLSFVET